MFSPRNPSRWTALPLAAALLVAIAPGADARRGMAPVSRSAAVVSVAAIDAFRVPPFDVQALLAEDAGLKDAPLKYAEPFLVSLTPADHGTWETLADGSRIWRLRIDAPQATDLNLGLSRYRLPPGATLHVSSATRDYLQGPYTWEDNREHGELWLPVTPGPGAIVELAVPADPKFEPEIEIGQIGWGFRDLFHLDRPHERQGSCNNDVICPEGDPWRDDEQAEAVYSTGGSTFCSGQMVTNVNGDYRNYFLTANHCGISSGNAASLVVYWNFESPNCGDLCCGSLADNQNGAVFRARRSDSDFCLVELDDDPDPAHNVFYAGFDATGDPVSSAVAIHHPNTDEKAISFQYDPLTVTTYLQNAVPGDGTHWRIDQWEDGTTEPGSSGSGLWDPNHRLVGQLHGGYASCSSITSDWYGRLSVSWDGSSSATRLRDWLDPGNTNQKTADGSYVGGVGSVAFVSFSSTDYCASGHGTGNGVWEPGEAITIPVTVRAAGGDHTNITGVLTSSTPGVVVLDGTATWPNLTNGSTSVSQSPHFKIELHPQTVDCYTEVELQLEVTSAEGGPWIYAFSQDVGQPSLPTGLPVAIPDGSGNVTHTFTVGQAGTISDLNVRVAITHTYVGDLKIDLQSPGGTTVTLLDRPGVPASTYGCSNDNMNVTFDDASGVNLESWCPGTTPWYSGVAAPVGTLAAFNGQALAGTWRLIVSDNAGADTGTLDEWELITTPALTGVCDVCEMGTGAPVVSAASGGLFLAQNRPNPFSPSTVIRFALPEAGSARLEIYDVAGRRVRTLVDGPRAAGPHAVTWDGTDEGKITVAAGIYFYRLTSGERTSIKRMNLVR